MDKSTPKSSHAKKNLPSKEKNCQNNYANNSQCICCGKSKNSRSSCQLGTLPVINAEKEGILQKYVSTPRQHMKDKIMKSSVMMSFLERLTVSHTTSDLGRRGHSCLSFFHGFIDPSTLDAVVLRDAAADGDNRYEEIIDRIVRGCTALAKSENIQNLDRSRPKKRVHLLVSKTIPKYIRSLVVYSLVKVLYCSD